MCNLYINEETVFSMCHFVDHISFILAQARPRVVCIWRDHSQRTAAIPFLQIFVVNDDYRQQAPYNFRCILRKTRLFVYKNSMMMSMIKKIIVKNINKCIYKISKIII